MTPLTFPYGILKAFSYRLDIVGAVVSGGLTLSGQQQRVNATGGGLWVLQMDFPRFSKAEQIRAWRVIQYGSQGGVFPVNIPICDLRQAPRPSGWMHGSHVPHSDGTPFSDTSLYASDTIIATLTTDADLRDTSIRVTFESDSVPQGGEYFSLAYGEDRHELHVVLSAVPVSGNTYDLTFVPPLRADHLAGETITWDHPTGTFVLAQPDAMSMATEYQRFGDGSAQFVEYIG